MFNSRHGGMLNNQRKRTELARTKTCLRSQIYIKLTRSNDSSKYPLKYFCLKCHIWWELNKTYFPFGVYRHKWAFCSFFFVDVLQKMINNYCVLTITVDSRYYELACNEVPVITRFFAGPELPRACFNALKYGLYEHGSSENTVITR